MLYGTSPEARSKWQKPEEGDRPFPVSSLTGPCLPAPARAIPAPAAPALPERQADGLPAGSDQRAPSPPRSPAAASPGPAGAALCPPVTKGRCAAIYFLPVRGPGPHAPAPPGLAVRPPPRR